MPGIIGPAIGGLLGGAMSDGGGGQSVSKEPWADAAPWLRENLRTGQQLQNYYQQNPFNSIQQTSMQNMLGDIDNFRSNINPGLMDFANRLMNTNYSRSGGPGRGGYGGYGGYGGGMGGMQGGGGMMGPAGYAGPASGGGMGGLFDAQMAARGAPRESMGDIDQFIASATGTLGPGAMLAAGMQNQSGGKGRGGPFSAPVGQAYGLLDWAELNPFTAANGIKPEEKPSEEELEAERRKKEEEDAIRRYMESERGGAGA